MFVPITLNLSQLVGDVSLSSVARGDLLMRGASKWNNFAPGTSGHFLKSAGAGADLTWSALAAGDIPDLSGTYSLLGHTHAHSAITSPAVGDDHTQYALLAGRSGGQTVDGGTAASEKLILNSTAHATKGLIQFGDDTNKACFDEANGNLIVGALATDASQSSSSPRKLTAYGSRNNASFRCHTNETGTSISAVFELGNSNGGNFTQMAKLQDLDNILTLENVTGDRVNVLIAGTIRTSFRNTHVQEIVVNSNTTTPAIVHYFDNSSSGTAGNGFGSTLQFRLESSTTDSQDAGSITCAWTDATHATRTSYVSLSAYYTSTAQEILKLSANSSGVASSTAVFTGRPSAPFGSGTNCERFGAGSGGTATTGNDNTVFGSGAGSALTSAQRTVAIGKDAGNTITTSQLNTIIGYDADVSGTSVAQAVAIGGQTVVGNRGVAIGRGAQATADPSVAVGESAIASAVSAIAIGASLNLAATGSIGIGSSLTMTGTGQKIAIGSTLSVTHSDCFFFGEGSTSDQAGELRFTNRNTGVTRLGATALSSTDADRKQFSLDGSWVVNTDASRESRLDISTYYTTTPQLGIRIDGNATSVKMAFFGVTTTVARPSAYTQTYSTTTKTHAALTSATLTDNTAGTANTTVQALTDPADAPASADALRDDLVANLIPELRNNFADLVAQVNALRVDLENAKQVINAMIDDDQSLGLKQ